MVELLSRFSVLPLFHSRDLVTIFQSPGNFNAFCGDTVDMDDQISPEAPTVDFQSILKFFGSCFFCVTVCLNDQSSLKCVIV